MDDYPWLFILLLVSAILLSATHWSLDNIPSSLSMTIVKVPEVPDHAVVSFIVDADAARIAQPFHWDLLEDIPLGRKHLYSVVLDQQYFNQLVSADEIVVEGYHGLGNWSRQVFTTKRFSYWTIKEMRRQENHVDSIVDINGKVQAPYALFWTTVPYTSVRFPHAFRNVWIKRTAGTGGYWPYKVAAPLDGRIAVQSDLPPIVLGLLPLEPLTALLKKKVGSLNIVLAEEGMFSITTVNASLRHLAQDLRVESASS